MAAKGSKIIVEETKVEANAFDFTALALLNPDDGSAPSGNLQVAYGLTQPDGSIKWGLFLKKYPTEENLLAMFRRKTAGGTLWDEVSLGLQEMAKVEGWIPLDAVFE